MIRKILDHIEEGLVIILLVLMCVIVTLQVFFRLVLQIPLIWSEELATLLFVWVVMIGASLALKRREHFAVELLQRRLPQKDRKLLGILVGTTLIIFSLLVLIEGLRITWMNYGVTTAAMEISRAYAYASIPAGGSLMLLRSAQILFKQCREQDIPGSGIEQTLESGPDQLPKTRVDETLESGPDPLHGQRREDSA